MSLLTTFLLFFLLLLVSIICFLTYLSAENKTVTHRKTRSKVAREKDKPVYIREQLQILQSRSSWGESQTITLFELAFKQPVTVWEAGKNGRLSQSINFQSHNPEEKTPINILFNGVNHYDFLKPVRDEEDSFDVITCRPDGNCLFRALAKGLQSRKDSPFRDYDYFKVKKYLLWYLTTEKGEKKFRKVIDNKYKALSKANGTKKNKK